MGFIRFRLMHEFGFGKEAKKERKAFLKEHGGIKGLRSTLYKDGVNGFNRTFASYHKKNEEKNKPKPQEDERAEDRNNPDQEWSKQAEKKLAKVKADPKLYKEFEADSRQEAIAKINQTVEEKDFAGARGIVEQALQDQELSSRQLFAAFGGAGKEDMILPGKVNEKGLFHLYRAGNTDTPIASISIGAKGDFSVAA